MFIRKRRPVTYDHLLNLYNYCHGTYHFRIISHVIMTASMRIDARELSYFIIYCFITSKKIISSFVNPGSYDVTIDSSRKRR